MPLLSNVYRSRPVSRVLSLDSHSSRPIVAKRLKQPTRMLGEQRRCILFGLAADGVWPATDCYQPHGALLPHHFTLTCAVLPQPSAVMLSVPLSVASRRPAVSRHPALCSPDFPPRPRARRLSGLLRYGRDYNGLGGKGYLKSENPFSGSLYSGLTKIRTRRRAVDSTSSTARRANAVLVFVNSLYMATAGRVASTQRC